MTSSCAACRRASDIAGYKAICASCSWTEARTQSQASSSADTETSALSSAAGEDEDQQTSTEDACLLFHLALLVGENGSVIVERVLRQLVRGNTRTYRTEMNRLTAKFIASLETASLHT